MKRRNLIYGMGLLAMGSGAAALSGATLTNAVSPAASFRVNVEGGLEVAKGKSFPISSGSSTVTASNGNNANVNFITSGSTGSGIFDELSDTSAFTAVADTGTDDALNVGVAFPFSEIPDSDGPAASFEFPKLLEITNNNLTDTDVAITYGNSIDTSTGGAPTIDADNGFETAGGSDLTNAFVSETGNTSGPTQLSFDEAAEMFQFTTDGTLGNAISPAGNSGSTNANQDEANSVTITGDGGAQDITLNVEISTVTGGKIHDFVSEESLTVGSFTIIDQIFVGESDETPLSS
jgi:hypothetical protein